MKPHVYFLAFALVGFGIVISGCPSSNTPSNPSSSGPTNTPSNTPTAHFTSTQTHTVTPSFTPTVTLTATSSSTGTQTATPTETLTATVTFSPTVTATNCDNQIFSDVTHGGDVTGPYSIYYFYYHASAAVTVTQISMAILDSSASTTYEYQFGVYADDGTQTGPTALLGDTGLQTYPGQATGSVTVTGTLTSAVTLVAGNDYWLAMHTDATVFDDYPSPANNSAVLENAPLGMANGLPSPSVLADQSTATTLQRFAFWSGPCP